MIIQITSYIGRGFLNEDVRGANFIQDFTVARQDMWESNVAEEQFHLI